MRTNAAGPQVKRLCDCWRGTLALFCTSPAVEKVTSASAAAEAAAESQDPQARIPEDQLRAVHMRTYAVCQLQKEFPRIFINISLIFVSFQEQTTRGERENVCLDL